ncbi:hypothetical protein BCR34DRAFT_491583 [Clohesyomyces aquaticus]|uniref:Uncharacterized protein n=1 Tax=Clohesyomyces aquaticus TaxID=1231657 RepID=A0A1Y1Z353_9PLEO|nr:hypothetical protein BCR34DRAFT_491583 [Clohesyomyces aquaticus]
MFRPTFVRALRKPPTVLRRPPSRPYAAQPQPQPAPASHPRIKRFNRRLPKFLHKYTNALGTAPVTHITAFLLLHEITAIVPLLGLAATFHYTHWLPSWFAEGTWVLQGVERFGKYFRRKGWIRSDEASQAEHDAHLEKRKRDKAFDIGEGGVRVVVEFATAYAITKMFLPLRIVVSVWGTPWFARRTVIPIMDGVKRRFGKGKPVAGSKSGSGAAATGAVEGGIVPKGVAGKGKVP